MRTTNRLSLGILVASAALGLSATTAHAGHDHDVDVRVIKLGMGKARLGIRLVELPSAELRRHLGGSSDAGFLVDAVEKKSPAGRAGIRVGDVIVRVDGDKVISAHDTMAALSDRKKGDKVKVHLVRNRRKLVVTAALDSDVGEGHGHKMFKWHGKPMGKELHELNGILGGFDIDKKIGEEIRKEMKTLKSELEDLRKELKKLKSKRR